MRIVENIQLRIGCYWGYILLASLLLFILLFTHFGSLAIWLLVLMVLLTFFGFVYYQHFAKERLDNFTKMLIHTGKHKFNILDSKAHVLIKKGRRCSKIQATRKTNTVSIIYFSDEYLTLSTKCPTFHLFKQERLKLKDKWAVKKSCALNKEYYYAYIQSVHFNPETKKLDIVLTSGDIESIDSDKKPAESAVNILRERLRKTDRGLQTNPIKTA